MSDHNENHGVAYLVLGIPAALTIGFFSLLGWAAAVAEWPYRIVRAVMWPLTFVLTQFFGGMAFVTLGWFTCLIFGARNAANYVVGHTADLTLLTSLFGELSIPFFHVLVFQFCLWLVLGRRIGRHLTFSIYDAAIQSIGHHDGIHPAYVRERIRQQDSGYAKAEEFFARSGKPPVLGLILVGLSRTPISEYY